jgi:hypothetical protein
LPFDSAAAREFAEIAASRRRAGRPISEADARIAAIARSRGAAPRDAKRRGFCRLPAGIDRSLGLSRQRVEHHHRAVDRGRGAVGAWWPGVSSRLKASPSCSELITAEETEMPRSRSIAIQSERTRRRSPRALTSPASWIARQTSSGVY